MLAAVMTLLGSSTIGSALGGFFAWLNKQNDLAVMQLQLADKERDRAHELALRDKDLAQAQAEAAAKKDVAIVEGDVQVDAARMAALAAVQVADVIDAAELGAAGWWKWALVLADAFKKSMRPLLTVALIGAALALNWMLIDAFVTHGWSALAVTERHAAAMLALAWITGQASVVVSYWFVARGSARSS